MMMQMIELSVFVEIPDYELALVLLELMSNSNWMLNQHLLEFDSMFLDGLQVGFDKKYMKNDDYNLLNDQINVDDVELYHLYDYDRYQIQHVHSTFEVHQEEVEILTKNSY